MPLVRVARHGETTWNQEGRYQGRLEAPLSALGRRQAEALAQALREQRLGRVISSPLERCMQTARPVAQAHGIALEPDERLLEIAHGTWEGRLRGEIERDDPGRYRAWRRTPESVRFEGGESLADVLARWRSFVAETAFNVPTLVVTHDVVVRLAILESAGGSLRDLWQPRVVNGGFAEFAVSARGWHLLRECVDEHLHGHLADSAKQAL